MLGIFVVEACKECAYNANLLFYMIESFDDHFSREMAKPTVSIIVVGQNTIVGLYGDLSRARVNVLMW